MRGSVRAWRKLGICHKVMKGQSSDIGELNGGFAQQQKVEIFKGRHCVTPFALRKENPMNRRKSAWRGAKKGKLVLTEADPVVAS